MKVLFSLFVAVLAFSTSVNAQKNYFIAKSSTGLVMWQGTEKASEAIGSTGAATQVSAKQYADIKSGAYSKHGDILIDNVPIEGYFKANGNGCWYTCEFTLPSGGSGTYFCFAKDCAKSCCGKLTHTATPGQTTPK